MAREEAREWLFVERLLLGFLLVVCTGGSRARGRAVFVCWTLACWLKRLLFEWLERLLFE